MKAIVYTMYGPPDVLQLREVQKPIPRDNEILVKVRASTVTSAALWARTGKHPDSRFFTFMVRIFFGLWKPRKKVLGYEFAGEIESLGEKVKLFRKGDPVFGTTTHLKQGAYAEYVCIPEKWKQGVVALKPENLSFEEAAALPCGGMAAMYILRKGEIKKGQKVLIYGASGSVGTYAVQLARNQGAIVTGVCSKTNLEMVKSLGANQVIDYTQEDFTKTGEKYDLIFDAVGKISKTLCENSLVKNGTFLSAKTPTKELSEDLLTLQQLAEEGKISPAIDRSFTLEQTAKAHAYADKGHKKGNVVITLA